MKRKARKHLGWYRGRTIKRSNLQPWQIESGMICEVNYRIKATDTKKLSRAYPFYILVLHPGWPNYKSFFHQKVHCLRLDHVSPSYFKQLYKSTGLKDSKKAKDIKKLNLDILNLNERESKRFYIRSLKPYMKTRYYDCYRTLHRKQLSYVRVVTFLFDKL